MKVGKVRLVLVRLSPNHARRRPRMVKRRMVLVLNARRVRRKEDRRSVNCERETKVMTLTTSLAVRRKMVWRRQVVVGRSPASHMIRRRRSLWTPRGEEPQWHWLQTGQM